VTAPRRHRCAKVGQRGSTEGSDHIINARRHRPSGRAPPDLRAWPETESALSTRKPAAAAPPAGPVPQGRNPSDAEVRWLARRGRGGCAATVTHAGTGVDAGAAEAAPAKVPTSASSSSYLISATSWPSAVSNSGAKGGRPCGYARPAYGGRWGLHRGGGDVASASSNGRGRMKAGVVSMSFAPRTGRTWHRW
jgi:hypothetical protein